MENTLVGQTFYYLTVIQQENFINQRGRTFVKWRCRCICGSEVVLSEAQLRNGSHKTCGCKTRPESDLSGQRFGRLVAMRRDDANPSNWLWRCDCGTVKSIKASNVKRGLTRSCGCYHKECVTKALLDDLTDQTFGRWTVIKKMPDSVTKSGKRSTCWLCRCECGTTKTVRASALKDGTSTSCGCFKREFTSELLSFKLEGQQFGKLTVVERAGTSIGRNGTQYSQWRCRCECGGEKIVRGHDLTRGTVSSCGCLISKGEEEARKALLAYGIQFTTQVQYADLKSDKGWPLRFDFGLLDESNNIIALIEYQGIQHFIEQPQGFGKQQREVTDRIKREYCERNHIPLFAITYLENTTNRIYEILESLNITHVNSVPSPTLNDGEGVTTISRESTPAA